MRIGCMRHAYIQLAPLGPHITLSVSDLCVRSHIDFECNLVCRYCFLLHLE